MMTYIRKKKIKGKTYCKDCIHKNGLFTNICDLLENTAEKTIYPCGNIEYKYPLKHELIALGVMIGDKSIFKNSVYTCSLNKGNCPYYEKRKWYKIYD